LRRVQRGAAHCFLIECLADALTKPLIAGSGSRQLVHLEDLISSTNISVMAIAGALQCGKMKILQLRDILKNMIVL
jgi:imidazole glycerol phosphate synthase subunit HisF